MKKTSARALAIALGWLAAVSERKSRERGVEIAGLVRRQRAGHSGIVVDALVQNRGFARAAHPAAHRPSAAIRPRAVGRQHQRRLQAGHELKLLNEGREYVEIRLVDTVAPLAGLGRRPRRRESAVQTRPLPPASSARRRAARCCARRRTVAAAPASWQWHFRTPCGWPRRFSARARFACQKCRTSAGSDSRNNACRRIFWRDRVPAASAGKSRSGLSTRKTGQSSATAGFIITLASHSVAEMIFGCWFQSFHGSVFSVCFSRISSSELRASESMRLDAAVGGDGQLAEIVIGKILVLGRLQIAEKPQRHHEHQQGRKPFLENLFHVLLLFGDKAGQMKQELDHQAQRLPSRIRCRASTSRDCAPLAAPRTACGPPVRPPGRRPSGIDKKCTRHSAADGSWKSPPRASRRSEDCQCARGCENPWECPCPDKPCAWP